MQKMEVIIISTKWELRFTINCSSCNPKYITQSKRLIGVRFKEHLAYFREISQKVKRIQGKIFNF